MDGLLRVLDVLCVTLIGALMRTALAVDEWRGKTRRRALRLRGSLRKLYEAFVARHHVPAPQPPRRWRWNRTAPEIEAGVVRLHVEQPHLGAGQLRHLAFRVLGAKLARETVRNILLRSRDEIAALEKAKRKPPRRIVVTQANKLWGLDLSLVWMLGFFPMWILGIVDYHGSRLVALEPVRWPTAACVVAAVERAFASQGVPARILSDRGSVFRGELFEKVLVSRGVIHTMTRPCHPWTNGRIERVFRSFKETVRTYFWLLRSRAHVADVCSDFRTFYNGHRPHQAYGGRTPDEVHRGRPAASGHLGRISFFEGRMHWWRFS